MNNYDLETIDLIKQTSSILQFSDSQLAEYIDVSVDQIGQWKKGIQMPSSIKSKLKTIIMITQDGRMLVHYIQRTNRKLVDLSIVLEDDEVLAPGASDSSSQDPVTLIAKMVGELERIDTCFRGSITDIAIDRDIINQAKRYLDNNAIEKD